jgi:hypothetical protein
MLGGGDPSPKILFSSLIHRSRVFCYLTSINIRQIEES